MLFIAFEWALFEFGSPIRELAVAVTLRPKASICRVFDQLVQLSIGFKRVSRRGWYPAPTRCRRQSAPLLIGIHDGYESRIYPWASSARRDPDPALIREDSQFHFKFRKSRGVA